MGEGDGVFPNALEVGQQRHLDPRILLLIYPTELVFRHCLVAIFLSHVVSCYFIVNLVTEGCGPIIQFFSRYFGSKICTEEKRLLWCNFGNVLIITTSCLNRLSLSLEESYNIQNVWEGRICLLEFPDIFLDKLPNVPKSKKMEFWTFVAAPYSSLQN